MKEAKINVTVLIILFFNSSFRNNECHTNKENDIVVQLYLDQSKKDQQDSINLDLRLMEKIGDFSYEAMQSRVINGLAKWNIKTDKPYEMVIRLRKNQYIETSLLEPGDSIIIIEEKNKEGENDFYFYGTGVEKFILKSKLNKIRDSLKVMVSNPFSYKTNSIQDYLEWNRFLNKQLEILLPLIESYKDKISPLAYTYIRNITLDGILDARSDKFGSFRAYAAQSGISKDTLSSIYDSTYALFIKDWALPSLSGNFFGSWAFVRLNVLRQFNFNVDSMGSGLRRSLLYYEYANKMYKGIARQKFLIQFFSKQMIKKLGFIPETEHMLEDYYSESGYPEYKILMKEYEKRARILVNGSKAPDFTLYNENNEPVNKTSAHGKVVLMDFWFTGCIGCVQMAPIIQQVEHRFANDSNVLFISISTDKSLNQWRLSNNAKKYTSGSGIKLYTGGQGNKHSIIKDYNIGGYPSLYLLDMMGNIAGNPISDPRLDKGERLIKLIEKQLVEGKDGPYVFDGEKKRITYSINGDNLLIDTLDEMDLLKVSTDEYCRDFEVKLKKNLVNESSIYEKPPKLLVLSDIEGNFKAFRELLQANKVIDSNYNWIFDKGHLLFNGDLFDRGNQVTECLWLIYSLEEKAKAKGGYVHFILGNHEIMNLNNDARYLREKYLRNAKMIKNNFEFYNNKSELGKWLRTKNIAERIGDILFVHAGISKEVIKLPLDIKGLNESSRVYYDKSDLAKNNADKALSPLFSTESSPFWYRSYYLDAAIKIYSNGDTVHKAPAILIDETLKKFKVKHIVTGHTIVADTVSLHYDNKVINIDTKHAEGNSEALFIEGNSYYRVNNTGQKIKLFQD